MSADSRRMGRIRGYRDTGIAVGQHDVDWLIAEVARLTADRDRYKAWHDAVLAQGHTRGLIVRPQPLKENE